MDKKKKSIFNQPLNVSGGTHATMLVVIGAYIAYMGYEMIRDTLSGASSMSLTTTVILAGLMILAGLAVLAYGAWMGLKSFRDQKKEKREEQPDEE